MNSLGLFDSALAQLSHKKQIHSSHLEALEAFDAKCQSLVEDMSEISSLLRKIDPALVQEPRMRTGFKIADLALRIFYTIKQFMFRDTISILKPKLEYLRQTLDPVLKSQERLDHVDALYNSELNFTLRSYKLLDPKNAPSIERLNRKYGLAEYATYTKKLNKSQLDPQYQPNIARLLASRTLPRSA